MQKIKKMILSIYLKGIKTLLNLSKTDVSLFSMELYKEDFKSKHLNPKGADIIEKMKVYHGYVPDRYSDNLTLYKENYDFFDNYDLKNWLSGNFNNNIGDLSRFYFLNHCFEILLEQNIVGNVAELGVYKGNSAFLLGKYARHPKVQSKCYLFDTYEGFDQRDFVHHDKSRATNAFKDTSLEIVKKNVGEGEHIVYVKGYFPDSLEQVGEIDSFSLVHLDCDLGKPMKDALEYFYPRMLKGGFIIMHDYSSMYWDGAKQAVDSFFKDKSEFIIPIPDKSGTCVIRKV